MRKVIVFGTFDVLHPGHLDFFRQAKKHGDFLVAVVARDSNVKKIKGKSPASSERRRLLDVYNVPEVDLAVLGYREDPYKVIEEQKPDIICLGYDQDSYSEGLDKELEKRGISAEIKRMKPHKEHKYKSSKLNPA